MKKFPVHIYFLLQLFIIVLLISCRSSAMNTLTNQNTDCVTPTLVNTDIKQTAKPFEQVSATPVPTLEWKEQDKYVLGLFSLCDLPCWWGIHPNTSDWNDLRELLAPQVDFDEGFSGTQYKRYHGGIDFDKLIWIDSEKTTRGSIGGQIYSGTAEVIDSILVILTNRQPNNC